MNVHLPTHKMMSLKSLLFLLFAALYAVDAFPSEELEEFARMASKVDLDTMKDLLTDAIADEIKSGVFNEAVDSEESEEKGSKDRKSNSESDESSAESRLEGSWLDLDSEPSSIFEDPDENDALYSRDAVNPHKRDEYFESLEKKSQRSTYVPPPRKNFYSTSDDIDASASEEHFHGGRRPDHGRPPHRMIDPMHFLGESDPLADVIHAESHPLMESLHLLPTHAMFEQRAMQSPPWRYQGKSFPMKQMPMPNAPPMAENAPPMAPPKPSASVHPAPAPAEPEARKPVMHKRRKSYRKPSARRPAPPPVPVHMKMHHNHDDSKFKSLPRSKPWTADFKKEPITPKFTQAGPDDSVFLAPSTMGGRPIRQQFHEQGTRGPHSYKFGYSTGDVENPMARYEERDADGIVRGSYSYVDPRGQKQVIHYESHPKFGFKTRSTSNY